MLPMTTLAGISGILYPTTALPGRVAGVAQAVHWMGLDTRPAPLPNAAVAVEIGRSWRTPTTFGVRAAWAIAGFLVAPLVLRRMARRESGVDMQERRNRTIARMSG